MSKNTLPRGLQQENEQYRIRFSSKHTNPGKMYRERLPAGTTRRQAEAYLSKLREADRMGTLLWPDEREAKPELPSVPTVGEFATDTYMPYCETRNATPTLRAKRQAFEATEPWFWEVPLDQVDLALAHRYQIERKAEGVRARTVNMQWETIRHMLSYAHRLGVLPFPPPKVDPLPTKDKKPVRWLTEVEATLALENAANKGSMWYALTLFLLSTGARWGETRVLRWDDVDLKNAQVYLRAENAKHGKDRFVPLLPELVEAMSAVPRGGEMVWMRRHHKTEEWIELKHNAKALGGKYPWQGKDGEPNISPHVFRHTFATWRLQRGESLKIISEYLGHASIQLTSDLYGHVRPFDKADAIANAPRPVVRRLRVIGEGKGD